MKPERDSPDPAALAKRFMDLWQEQMTALAGDPALADSVARFMAALPPGLALWPGFHDRANRAPAAAAASDERGERVDQLASRLDAIEQRLARLESGAGPGGGGVRGKPKKRPA
jgi:non-ribosomal peptide synthetase component F